MPEFNISRFIADQMKTITPQLQKNDDRILSIEREKKHDERVAVLDADGYPKRAQRVVLNSNSFEQTTATRAVESFIDSGEEKWLLMLAGSNGNGKTVAATWLGWITNNGRTAAATGHIRRYFTARELSTLSEYRDEIELIKRVPILVIDELGREHDSASGYAVGLLESIITYRYDNDLKTVICTNLSMREIANRYDPMLIDRMRHGASIVNINEKTRRG